MKTPAGNRRLAKKRIQCLNEALCFVSNSVLADSLELRKAQKRYPKPPTKNPIRFVNGVKII